MLDALFFDLDGTLLGLDVQRFLPAYFASLVEEIGSAFPEFPFRERLLRGAETMIGGRRAGETVAAAFDRVFFDGTAPDVSRRLRDAFAAYYTKGFDKLRTHTERFPEASEAVREGRRRARAVVLATNPLFPREATLARLAWAGVDPGLFDGITTYEDARTLKPDPAYYTELLEAYGAKASDAWMIGNDLLEDGIAKEAGMSFYFVDGPFALKRPGAPPPDRRGSLADTLAFIRSL